MYPAELTLRYTPEDDWHGQLAAIVNAGEFAGAGSAWFQRHQLKETFIGAIRAYPLSTSNPPMIEGGIWSSKSSGKLEQCNLRIMVRPYNPRGTLLVQADLTGEGETAEGRGLDQSLTARFLTEYSILEKFAADFEGLLDGKRETATLPGAP